MSYKTERVEEFKVLTRSQLARKYKNSKMDSSDKIGPLPKDWKSISIHLRPERDRSKPLKDGECGHCGGPTNGGLDYFCSECKDAMDCGPKKGTYGTNTGV